MTPGHSEFIDGRWYYVSELDFTGRERREWNRFRGIMRETLTDLDAVSEDFRTDTNLTPLYGVEYS